MIWDSLALPLLCSYGDRSIRFSFPREGDVQPRWRNIRNMAKAEYRTLPESLSPLT